MGWKYNIFEVLPDDVSIWRYMSLWKWQQIIKRRALYFANVEEFKDDPFEGTCCLKLAQQLEEQRKANTEDQTAIGCGLSAFLGAVSCWHENNDESYAMWRLYASECEGVAIQSTVGKLKISLPDHGKDPGRLQQYLIGRVQYLDYQSDYFPGAKQYIPYGLAYYLPLFCKRRNYSYEKEVRFVVTSHDLNEQGPKKGNYLPVDLSYLIQRVVVSPKFLNADITCLQREMEACGLNIPIQKSEAQKVPNEVFKNAIRDVMAKVEV